MKISIIKEKIKLRQKMIKKRKDLSAEYVKKASEKIIYDLMTLKAYKEANIIAVYIDFNNEISTKGFIEKSLKLGKKVVVPVILKNNERKKLFLSEIKNMSEDLSIGELGILTPKKEKLSLIDTALVDLCIVSGLAYDVYGNRLGFGAGYYDRLLKELNINTITLALAYDFQLFDSIPVLDYDMKINIIITEKKLLYMQ